MQPLGAEPSPRVSAEVAYVVGLGMAAGHARRAEAMLAAGRLRGSRGGQSVTVYDELSCAVEWLRAAARALRALCA